MDHSQNKQRLLHYIEQADEQLLEAIVTYADTLAQERNGEKVNGVTAHDHRVIDEKNPATMTGEELNAELDQAMRDYEEGRYTSLEELEKELESW